MMALASFAVVLVLAALAPILTAEILAAVLLRGAPDRGEERARRLVPFRTAAFLVGFAQIQVAWMAGARVMAESAAPVVFGAIAAAIAFLAGGVGRRVEEPPGVHPADRPRAVRDDRSTVWGAMLLRARLLPWFAGTSAAAAASAALPVVGEDGTIHGWMVLLSLALSVIGVAYGGLAASVLFRALVPAGAAVRAIAEDVAAREKTSLRLVLRLPTQGARFANAAAIPWARTMVVTDRIVELLTEDELRAVLAHEAGHLSEPPRVVAARLGSGALLLFSLTTATRVAEALGVPVALAAATGIMAAIVLLLGVRRLARGMEERADARAKETVGPAPLAEALRKLHADGQMPMVTGARRVHPDLYDRLTALGVDPGPRPAPPPRRRGLVVGGALAGMIVLGGVQILGIFAGR
jgi:Zn-dependent protease with chaperone function